jgi:hypothetical protein
MTKIILCTNFFLFQFNALIGVLVGNQSVCFAYLFLKNKALFSFTWT